MANVLMPGQTLTTDPPVPFFERMDPAYERASIMNVSPFNGTQQVYTWPKKLRYVQFTLPILNATQAQDWIEFIDDLNGMENTFTVDLSFAFPHEAGVTAVLMRLVSNTQNWSVMEATKTRMSFLGMEAK